MVRSFCFNVLALLGSFAMVLLQQPAAFAQSLARTKVITVANKMKGTPYVYGGTSPNGFDCSGLVQYVFRKVNIALPRTADQQFQLGSPVPFNQAKPGDLMFFNTSSGGRQVNHVGIYMGNSHMLHAPRPGKRVQYASVGDRSWFRPRLLGIRRITPQTYALGRKPSGWEVGAIPAGLLSQKASPVQAASL